MPVKRRTVRNKLLSFRTYLKLVVETFFHPNNFVKKTPGFYRYKKSLLYFLINLVLGLVLYAIIKIQYSGNSEIFIRSKIIFPIFSEVIFYTPFIAAAFLLFVSFLHFVAKLSGGQATLLKTIRSSCLLSAPLIFIWIPYIQIPAIMLQIYLLIQGFGIVHLYSKKIAALNILMPTLSLYLFLLRFRLITFP